MPRDSSSHRRRQQGRERDDDPAGAPLLAIEVDVGVARQALDRGGDHPADDLVVVADRVARALFRHRPGVAHRAVELAVHHPKLGAPALGRQVVAAVAVLFERAHDLVDHLIVVAQEHPVAVVAVLFLQRFAQHVDTLLVAVFDVVDKAAFKADAHPNAW